MRVLVTDPIAEDGLDILRERVPVDVKTVSIEVVDQHSSCDWSALERQLEHDFWGACQGVNLE